MTLSFLQQNKVFIESSIVKDVLIFEWSPVMPLDVDTSTDVLYKNGEKLRRRKPTHAYS